MVIPKIDIEVKKPESEGQLPSMKEMAAELEEINARLEALSDVATSGNYNDLNNKPTLGSGSTIPLGESVGQMFYYTPEATRSTPDSSPIPLWWDGTAWRNSAGENVTWPIVYTLTGLTASNYQQPIAGQSFNTTLTPNEGYELPVTIEVKMDNVTLTVSTEYTYDSSTGQIAILGTGGSGGVTGALSITAAGVQPE